MGYLRVKNIKNGNITLLPEGFMALPSYQLAYEPTDEHEECATCKMVEPVEEKEPDAVNEPVGDTENEVTPFEAPTEPAETQTRKSRRKV